MARVLLHQMIKCNQLRGFQADVQKVGIHFILARMIASLWKDFGSDRNLSLVSCHDSQPAGHLVL